MVCVCVLYFVSRRLKENVSPLLMYWACYHWIVTKGFVHYFIESFHLCTSRHVMKKCQVSLGIILNIKMIHHAQTIVFIKNTFKIKTLFVYRNMIYRYEKVLIKHLAHMSQGNKYIL